MKPRITPHVVAVALMFGLSACTNPYDPVQRFIGGGLIGAGSGAAIGAAAVDGHGAALGAAIGGAVGALGGLITTATTTRSLWLLQSPALRLLQSPTVRELQSAETSLF